MEYIILPFILLFFFAVMAWEKYLHKRNINSIPFRIHVNGTRGKSSVSRLIASGLRAHGYRVICKTTGTQPQIINENTDEIAIRRGCTPNIIEQLKVIEFAKNANADVLIVECMALRPELQSYSEMNLIRSTHGVITNCGPDHLDIMGPSESDVALALSGTVPVNAKLFTNEKKFLSLLQSVAEDRGSDLKKIISENTVSDEQMNQFHYVEHRENVALALTVCQDLGVEKNIAFSGMINTKPDMGAMTITHIAFNKAYFSLLNAFAANDPDSSKLCWEQANYSIPEYDKKVMVVNCRNDRQDRSIQLALLASQLSDIDKIVVIGDGRQTFIQTGIKNGISHTLLIVPDKQTPFDILSAINADTGEKLLLVGIGNIKNQATVLLQFFNQEKVYESSGHQPLVDQETNIIYG